MSSKAHWKHRACRLNSSLHSSRCSQWRAWGVPSSPETPSIPEMAPTPPSAMYGHLPSTIIISRQRFGGISVGIETLWTWPPSEVFIYSMPVLTQIPYRIANLSSDPYSSWLFIAEQPQRAFWYYNRVSNYQLRLCSFLCRARTEKIFPFQCEWTWEGKKKGKGSKIRLLVQDHRKDKQQS